MLIPIILRYPLGIQQSILRVCRLRECPACIEVTAESDNDNTLTDLRNTVIRCIQQTKDHIIGQSILVSSCMVLFQKSKMLHPGHVLSFYDLWVLELKEYIVEVLTKGFPQQTSHILKDKHFRSYLTNGTDSLREHIPFIVVCLVLAAKRKRLTWRSSGNKLYLTSITIIMHSAYISLIYLPISDGRIPVLNIVIQIIAGILIPFVKSCMIEPGQLKSESETAGPAEEFNRVHHKLFPILSIVTTMPS